MNQSKSDKSPITVQTIVDATLEKVWTCWSQPEHIKRWCNASDDWHAPKAENDLRTGGKFLTRMEAKDGSFGFDFGGIYTNVREHSLIEYDMDDGRHVQIQFSKINGNIQIVETFDPEETNPLEMQQQGWQAILDNFKNYTERIPN
ncbi:MAG: SRPBCC family protein [Saprospiraceae bacterium]|nr:SRPBCC family protein [Saprospiraceae bacterium]